MTQFQDQGDRDKTNRRASIAAHHKHLLPAFAVLAASMVVAEHGSAQASPTTPVRLSVQLAQPVLLSGGKRTTYLKVALKGIPRVAQPVRAPINLAIVLDRSGSMAGDRLAKAKEAAAMLVRRLRPSDTVSVVMYDHNVNVLAPATRDWSRAELLAQIARIEAGGNTALFAGVSKGAAEVRKFLNRSHVNRVILLSDGKANVGPSSPDDLAQLGASLIKQGISVSTVGLGDSYNEDLMVALARASDGNHDYARTANDLARIFDLELRDLSDVVAREARIRIRCGRGVRPIRMLGRDAEIVGDTIVTQINDIYADHEKFVMIEVEIETGSEGEGRRVADVSVGYTNPADEQTWTLAGAAEATFTRMPATVENNTIQSVMVDGVALVAAENNKRAVVLMDTGKQAEAAATLESNAAFLDSNADRYQSEVLRNNARRNRVQLEMQRARPAASGLRKDMREYELQNEYQMRR